MLQDPLGTLTSLQARHGDIVGVLLGTNRVVIVSDPETAKQVLVDSPNVFIKTGTAFFPGSKLAGNGLLVSDGDTWRRQRRLATPAFRQAAVASYSGAMTAATGRLLRGKWRGTCVRDVYADLNELALEIATEALFGKGIGGPGGREVVGGRLCLFHFCALPVHELVKSSPDFRFLPHFLITSSSVPFPSLSCCRLH
jgi:cytochrome P450